MFPAFGTILVLVAAFFYSKFNLKSIRKLIFPAFGMILVLVAAFFYSKFNLQSIIKIIFLSFWQLMLRGKNKYINIYIYIFFFYMYIEFLYIVHWFWKKRWWWGGVLTVRFRIYIYTIWTHKFVYWIFIHSSLILEKTLMVGGGSNCTVSYIYIYLYIYDLVSIQHLDGAPA